MTGAPSRRRLTRRTTTLILSALGLAVLLTVLLAPEDVSLRGPSGTSTFDDSPDGGRLLFLLVGRLGWIAEQRETPLDTLPDSTTIEAVLAPAAPIGAADAHRLLGAVRAGAGLLYIANPRDALLDSLHLVPTVAGNFRSGISVSSCHGVQDSPGLPLWPAGRPLIQSVGWSGPPPAAPVEFGAVIPGRGELGRPAAAGVALGKGRVVVAVDPDLIRNDALRVCDLGFDVFDVRLLEYLSDGGRRWRVVFDEYDQGYGAHPGSLSAIAGYLWSAPSGRVLLALSVAGLLLLFAAAPRVIVPRDPERDPRRSPLEHAEALGSAYLDVHASRTATRWLLGGVRRRTARHFAAGARVRDEAAYLTMLAARIPALRSDIERVRAGLDQATDERALGELEAALERIEQHLITNKL